MNKNEMLKYLQHGAEITGGLVGGAIGALGGPEGAVIGGGVGVAISCGLKEVVGKVLSQREIVRIAASADYMISGVQGRLNAGESVRRDGFFDYSEGRSSASELFEGTLVKCKDQYQEKKIKYISKIFEKAIFDEKISPETANQLISMADSFTYRKLCVLSFFGNIVGCDRKNELMQEPYRFYPHIEFNLELEILKQDIFDLSNLGLIDANNTLMTSNCDIMPGKMELSGIGQELFRILGLNEIEEHELAKLFELLKFKSEYGASVHGTVNGEMKT